MSLRERITEALSSADSRLHEARSASLSGGSTCEHSHPTLDECDGCIDAWICYQQREERDDGTVVCGGCGRVLIHDTTAFKHDHDRFPDD